MTESQYYLLEKVKSLGVELKFPFFRKGKPDILAEPQDYELAQHIIDAIPVTKKIWQSIKCADRIVRTHTIHPPLRHV